MLADGRLVDYINRCSARPHQALLPEDVAKRYAAYGCQVLTVQDGSEGVDAIRRTIAAAEACTDKHTLITLKAIFGYGSPNRADSRDTHGAPLGRTRLPQPASSSAGNTGSSRSLRGG